MHGQGNRVGLVGIKLVTNMGAANPLAAAEKTCEVARSLGVTGFKIVAVTGSRSER